MGVPIIATLETTGVGNYPLVKDIDVLGGYSVVADLTARDAIRTGVRESGMIVWTQSSSQWWQLGSGLTNADWTELINVGGSGTVVTTGDVILAVTTTGNDGTVVGRPPVVTNGDYSAFPFLTIAGALNALPIGLLNNILINVGPGTFDPPGVMRSFFGNTSDQSQFVTCRIVGTTALATLATGPNSGTCNTGTTPLAIKKPTGANWTVDDLTGRYVLLTSGPGAATGPNEYSMGLILSNTIDTAVVGFGFTALNTDDFRTWNNVNNTTTFEIVDHATQFTGGSASLPLAGFINVKTSFSFEKIYFLTIANRQPVIAIQDGTSLVVCFCGLDFDVFTGGDGIQTQALENLYYLGNKSRQPAASGGFTVQGGGVSSGNVFGCLMVNGKMLLFEFNIDISITNNTFHNSSGDFFVGVAFCKQFQEIGSVFDTIIGAKPIYSISNTGQSQIGDLITVTGVSGTAVYVSSSSFVAVNHLAAGATGDVLFTQTAVPLAYSNCAVGAEMVSGSSSITRTA